MNIVLARVVTHTSLKMFSKHAKRYSTKPLY